MRGWGGHGAFSSGADPQLDAANDTVSTSATSGANLYRWPTSSASGRASARIEGVVRTPHAGCLRDSAEQLVEVLAQCANLALHGPLVPISPAPHDRVEV